jgi:iron complex outermembrane receptor protein
LPLIAPLSYQGNLRFNYKNLQAEGGVRMAARNSHCGTEYGETPTSGYAVWHLNIGSRFLLGHVATDIHLGVENLFDRYYATYSDWNHIPQKGRNIYVNATFQL